MTLTQDQPVRPWGMSRTTERLPATPLPYTTVQLDPGSQVTRFYDHQGGIVDMGTFATVTMSKPGDGAANAPNVADDSNTDQK
ncbi:putative ATP-grasp-modified RiPP [Nonomuraea sp. NPDC049141]|uniref:putative ATP-grasp-modified RiPP n=1 Tax=Nonomuraea sp. NPDC049141 TaxID=3155500 RepID=UPI0033FCBFBC